MRFDQILARLTPTAAYTFATTTQTVIVRRGDNPPAEEIETVPILDDYAAIVWTDKIIKKPTELYCTTEWDIMQWEKNTAAVIDKRVAEYGAVGDQLDMMYNDAINGTTTWTDHITAVKTANPKPTLTPQL